MYINEPNHHQSTQDSILTQNANKAERKLQRLTERKFKLRWILAISCLPLFGIYTAFGIAPQTLTTNIATSMVVEEVSLPTLDQALNDEANLAEKFWYKDYVRRDDTLQSVLTRLNIRNRDALEFIRSDSVASEIARSIIPGRQVKSETDTDGNLFHFEYQISADQFLTITKTADGYEAHQDERILEIRPVLKSAKINSSLFGATDAANIPDHIAIQLADIFESEINFHTDLRRGDRFNVIYEGSYDQGELIKSGEVLAAEFVNNGKVYRAVGFRDSNNQMQYYTPEGKSIHKSFLRSPLEFSRVSSGFSVARFHPVLQRMRAHKGVDFAAPTGTRIKASADAVVDFVGTKGGYGNVIILKHDNGISTVYGHLSRFAPELRRGSKVTQGQMIGFVGMSGVATGPHLHYEFLINGKHQDPMKVALPKNNTIQGGNKAQFETISNQMMAQLRLLGTSNIAALE
ncbi:M23 family metallopeptidase [Methylotenera mobilis]|uniref:M23 family metallopeptidase n=1 Tax=Methylotenera mobilis TaxID=359408 RepID=UPI00036C5569|nr:M23 family metallopeptidase [Methylotenera mobilis]PPC97197.1 MAG: M23 family peptidase [Methylotenera sp.]